MTTEAPKKMGPLQEKWLRTYKFFAETYGWSLEPQIPEEKVLAVLELCTADIHNTTCFQEGHCVSRRSRGCGYKKNSTPLTE